LAKAKAVYARNLDYSTSTTSMESIVLESESPLVSRQGARKEKQDHPYAPNPTACSGNCEKHDTKTKNPYRKYAPKRGSDVKKRVVTGLIVVTVAVSWLAILSFEYLALSAMDPSTNRRESSIFSPGEERNGENNDTSEGFLRRVSKPRNAYDSIFCRASSKKGDAMSSDGNRNNSSQGKNSKPVFLWGIPSTSSSHEIERRFLLRRTYLNFDNQKRTYFTKNPSNGTNPSDYDHRICSFHEFICDEQIQAKCQMVYVFFVAGHKNDTKSVPPLILNESITDFRDMLLPYDEKNTATLSIPDPDLREPGTVYLNIRENQFDGKMTTWFKFASLVANEYNSRAAVSRPIDYIFKVDSDLLLMTPHFFDWFDGVHKEQQKRLQEQTIDSHPSSSVGPIRRVYGGVEFPATNCAVNYTFDHPCPLPLSGPSYMSGELNFCSVDLATYISSNDCPRDQWTIPHEDVSLSNYVYSYQNNTSYHRKIGVQNIEEDQHINIVSVNTSRILLVPNMRADWTNVSLRRHPEVLKSGELLWGHSIARGNYKMYLYWKQDIKFGTFWNFFFRTLVSPVPTRSSSVLSQKKWGPIKKSAALAKKLRDLQNKN